MPNALGLLAEPQMRATPRNKLMGLLADALQGAQDYAQRPDPRMPGGKANPVLGLLADAASLQSLATTAQRVSYGEPLTNKGKANVPFLKPETADVAMMAPLAPRNALAALGIMGGMADTGAMRAVFGYHGTMQPGFDDFSLAHFGKTDAGWLGKGVYMTPSKTDASAYATVGGKPGGAVYRVDMDVKKPLVIDWHADNRSELLDIRRKLGPEKFSEWLKENGYDGVQFIGPKGAVNSAGERDIQWMAPDPAQVKQVPF